MQTMDEGARRWLHKIARQHHWRVASYIDLDDLVQDGYLTYHRVVTKYAGTKSRAHIMALFKRVYYNHLHDLANERSHSVPETLYADIAPDGVCEEAVWERLLSVVDTDLVFYSEAPRPVRELLSAISSDRGRKRLRSRSRVRTTPDSPPTRVRTNRTASIEIRPTLNEKFCSLLGCDPSKIDLVSSLRSYLTGAANSNSDRVPELIAG